MSLFAAGVVLFALLMATYSGRRFWLALASTAISMAAFVGFLFVAIAKEPNSIRAGLVWTAGKLQLVVDLETADMIAKAIERIPASVAVVATAPTEVPAPADVSAPEAVGTTPPAQVAPPSPCEGGQQGTCDTEASQANAEGAAAPEPPAPQSQSIQATSTPSFPAAKPAPAPKATPGSPVVWFLDDRQGQASSGGAGGFAINGMNASDQPFEEVHAVLKPDGGHSELALALNVEGQKSEGIVPAGARFSLGLATAKDEQIGGAILSFRYRQDGQSRTSIVYLTPSMVSRLANRG